jgi:hypothetical protein
VRATSSSEKGPVTTKITNHSIPTSRLLQVAEQKTLENYQLREQLACLQKQVKEVKLLIKSLQNALGMDFQQ